MNSKIKFLLIILIFVISHPFSLADDKNKSGTEINIDFCATLNSNFSDDLYENTGFKINRLRLDIKGKAADRISFRVRQSFNKEFKINDIDKISSSIEYANIKWQTSDRFSLTIGKQFIAIGGYEALANSMYVREFSEFNDNLSYYHTGLKGNLVAGKGKNHELKFQLVNYKPSTLPFFASVCWNGHFFNKKLNLIYALSNAPAKNGKSVYMFSCGNIIETGPFFSYLDIMYSMEGTDSQGRITRLLPENLRTDEVKNTSYLTLIGRFDYRINPNWKIYIKGAYETAGVYASGGIIPEGHYQSCWNTQASIEWYPTGKDDLRVFLHGCHKRFDTNQSLIISQTSESSMDKVVALASPTDYQRLTLGISYIIRILR